MRARSCGALPGTSHSLSLSLTSAPCRELTAKKQETQALVAEMECTAQAFEDMQEQNIHLLQQLKEKDDANFKVISERIKASSMQKLLMEEKDLLQSQLLGLGQEKSR